MASSGINYGAVNPAETQPYPIESVLAAIQAKDNPAEAHNLLDTYQAQRAANEGNYRLSLQGQHDFAYQQLAQQMKENYLKEGVNAAKTPGALSLIASNPLFADSGYDPGVIGGVETNLRRAQEAEIFQHATSGLQSANAAGFQPSTQQAADVTGGRVGPQGMGEAEKVANISGQYRLAAANARGRAEQSMTVPYKYGVDEAGHDLVGQIKVPVGASDAQIKAIADNAARVYGGIYPKKTGVAGTTPPGDVGSAPPPIPSQSITPRTGTATNLPMARQDAGKSGTLATGGEPSAASGQFVLDARIQNQAKTGVKMLPPDQRAQVLANARGTVLPVVPLVGGGHGFVGKDGKVYAVPR